MEFYQDLLLTALLSVLLAFILGKLAALGDDADDLHPPSPETAAAPSDPSITSPLIGEKRLRFVDADESNEENPDPAGEDALRSDPINFSQVFNMPDLDQDTREEEEFARSEVVETSDTLEIEKGDESELEIDISVEESAGSLLNGEDEWEGIERSEVGKLFGVAMGYVSSERGGEEVSRLSGEVQMELYGLQKVAMEGPCYEPQPLALMVSARAKWHAWQRLGSMNPEVAMEHYISLLTQSIPGWLEEKPGGDAKQDEGNDPPVPGVVGTGRPDSDSSLYSRLSSDIGSKIEDHADGDNSSIGSELSRQGYLSGLTFVLNLMSPTTVRFSSLYW